MSQLTAETLNLLVNAILPFAAALGIALGVVRLLGLTPGRLRLAFLLLPFGKLLWDFGRGVPGDSFLWAHLAGVVRDSGSLKIGLGATPPIGLRLEALMTANSESSTFGLSLGDLAALGCDRLAPWCAPALVSVWLGVASVLLGRRVLSAARFIAERRQLHRRGRRWRTCHVGLRTVDVFIGPSRPGEDGPPPVPYAAGLLRPIVCFPARAFAAMTAPEREAVLQHELAHVAQHHLALRGIVDGLACVFWFVPGARYLARKIADDCELMADDEAVKKVEPIDLASALVTVGEMLHTHAAQPRTGHAVFFGESKPRLVSRVERLVAPSRPARNKARLPWTFVRLLLFVITAQSILMMVVGNNA